MSFITVNRMEIRSDVNKRVINDVQKWKKNRSHFQWGSMGVFAPVKGQQREVTAGGVG